LAEEKRIGKSDRLYDIHQNCIKFFDDQALKRVSEMRAKIEGMEGDG
jgi:hypothetical protein